MSLNESCHEEVILPVTHSSQGLVQLQNPLLNGAAFSYLVLIDFFFIFERISKNNILSFAFMLELFLLMFGHRYQLSEEKSVLSEIIAISIV